MPATNEPHIAQRAAQAIDELQALIRRHFPEAAFEVEHGQDDPDVIHLIAVVDLEDRSEVLDVVLERLMELQIDYDLPLFVIVKRPTERALALIHTDQDRHAFPAALLHAQP